MESQPAGKPNMNTNFMMTIGLILIAAAALWWLAYYSQWQGAFRLLDVKILCLVGDAFECANFRDFIGRSAIPVYSPLLWWVGVATGAVGWLLAYLGRPG